MFGMGWTEILVIGVVALVVVGPKELPGLFRNVGQFVGKARGMAREFSRAMEDAADQSGMREASNTLKGLSNPKSFGLDKVKSAASAATWKPDSNTAKLSAEREAASKKIQDAAAQAATKRLEAEKAAQTADVSTPRPVVPKIQTPPVAPEPEPRAARTEAVIPGQGRAAARGLVNRPMRKAEVQKGAVPRGSRNRNAPVKKG